MVIAGSYAHVYRVQPLLSVGADTPARSMWAILHPRIHNALSSFMRKAPTTNSGSRHARTMLAIPHHRVGPPTTNSIR